MPRRGNNRGFELGVILLITEMMNMGFSRIPPVTLVTIIGQILLYLGVIRTSWSKWDVCISGEKVLKNRDYKTLIFSTFEHADDMHLYYNMVSYMVKGRSLENRYGSTNYFFFLAVTSILTSIMYVAIGKFAAFALGDVNYLLQCAIGFSGVIFALKVVSSCEEPDGSTTIFGTRVPVQYAAWLELVLIHILVPGASFMGHLAGILVGVLYCYTPLGFIVDNIISSITGDRFLHHRNFYKAYERMNLQNNRENNYFF